MSMLSCRLLALGLLALAGVHQSAQAAAQLRSPDGRIALSLDTDALGQAHYRVAQDGHALLLASPLGLRLERSVWAQGLRLRGCGPSRLARERYALIGKQSQVDKPYRETECRLRNAQGQDLVLVLRAFNDGVALHYRLQLPEDAPQRFVEELTGFRFPLDTRAWLQPMQLAQTGWKNTNPAYEEHYRMDIPVGQASPSAAGWVFPALYRVGQGAQARWVALSEAGLDGSFHAARLRPDSEGGVYRLGQPMAAEVFPGGERLPLLRGTVRTPWRVLALGTLPRLMNSTLGTDVAEPAIPFPPDKLRPGHAAWSWALGKDEATTFEVQQRFIDYAARMGWNYTLVDADWDRKIGWERLAELVAQGQRQGVGLWVWYNSSGPWNQTEYSPKSQLLEPQQRRAEFARLAALGIKGLKIDFFGGDGQSMIAYYVDIMKDAAAAGLLLNFHGATLPRGWSRTYPHLMTAEAVKGFEFATFEQRDQDAVARHIAMLPFTRNLFDPMDFTPMVFGDIPRIRRATRNGFELAQSVLLLSGVQHYAEGPEGMETVPAAVQEFLRGLPRQWDEQRFLAGEPGRYVVLARRAGPRWVVAGINADEQPRRLSLDLRFLGLRRGQLIAEGEGARDFTVQTMAGGRQSLTLAPRGGFVASFP